MPGDRRAARERQAATQLQGRLPGGGPAFGSGNFPEPTDKGRVRDRVAARGRQIEHGGTAPGRPANTGGKLPQVFDKGKVRDRAARERQAATQLQGRLPGGGPAFGGGKFPPPTDKGQGTRTDLQPPGNFPESDKGRGEAGIANLPTVSSGNFPELTGKGDTRDRVGAYVEGKEVRRMVEIKLPKCLLVLSEQELRSLLARDPELWITALRRGKAVMRQRQEEARGPKHIGEILPDVLTDIERRYLENNGN